MPSTADQRKSKLIERVVEPLYRRAKTKRPDPAERFLRQFYAHVAPDDILGQSPDNLCGAGLALWDQAQQRRPGTCHIRVYNPRRADQGWESSHTVIEIINDDMPFLVDSVTAALNRLGVEVYLVIHPILRLISTCDHCRPVVFRSLVPVASDHSAIARRCGGNSLRSLAASSFVRNLTLRFGSCKKRNAGTSPSQFHSR